MKRIDIFLVILIVFLFSCKNKEDFINNNEAQPIPLNNSFIRLNIMDDDTILRLNDDMSLYIPKGFIEENGAVSVDYVIMESAEDFISHKASTETIDNKHIRTVGMIQLNFSDTLGRDIILKKPITLLNNDNSDEVKLFRGNTDDGIVKWKEIDEQMEESYFVVETLGNIGGVPYAYRTVYEEDTILLPSYLYIQLSKVKHEFQKFYGRIDFYGNYAQGYKFTFENKDSLSETIVGELTELLNATEILPSMYFNHIGERYTSENSDSINPLRSIFYYTYSDSKLQTLTRDKKLLTVYDSGWYNFDIYIENPIVTIALKGTKQSFHYAVVTLNADRIIRAKNVKGELKLEFPIETKTKVMQLIAYDDKNIYKLKEFVIKSGEKVTIDVD